MLTNHSTDAVPKLSVIIPTYRPGRAIEELLLRLKEQTLQPYEIIVIDSDSNDGTAERARKLGAKVIEIDQRDFDHGGTRNEAAARTAGEVLVFMTQDALPADEHLLAKLVEPLLQDDQTACAYARQLPRPEAGVLERLTRAYHYSGASHVKWKADLPELGLRTFFCSNVCAAYRRDVFEQLGKFDAPVIFNEDLFFAAKSILADYGVAYAAEACVIHSHDYTLIQQFRRFFDNGVSMRRNAWVYEHSAVGKAGTGMVAAMIRDLVRSGDGRYVPLLIAESAAKFAGLQLGKRYRLLPRWLCRRFSMHRKIWDKLQSGASSAGGATMEG